jgi:hypothetical protein
MAPLTWRNVATPNLGDPIEAMRLSGTLMNQGFSGFNTALSNFSSWKDDQNARLVTDAAMRIQDPAELRRQLENGSLLSGMPGGTLRAQDLREVQGMAGTLLAQDQTQEAVRHARQINPITAATAQHTLDTSREQAPIQTDILRINRDTGRFSLDERQGESTAIQQAREFTERVRREGGSAGDFTEALETSNLSPRARQLAREELERATTTPSRLYPMAEVNADGTLVNPQAAPAAPARPGAPVSPNATPGSTPAAGQVAAAAGAGPRTTGDGAVLRPDASGSIAESIPIPETRSYVQRITAQARAANNGVLPTGSHEEIADALLPHVTRQESSGRQEATSPRGARGVMQLMPGTADELERRLGMTPGITRQNTPEGRAANLRAGRQYLIDQLAANGGNIELALAAYNAGPNRVAGWQAPGSARDLIRSSAGVTQTATERQQALTARAATQSQGIVPEYAAAVQNTTATPGSVVNELLGTANAPGPYHGRSRADVTEMVQDIITRGQGRINAATAGAILQRRVSSGAVGILDHLAGWTPYQTKPNSTRVDEDIQQFLSQDIAGQVRAANQTTAYRAEIVNAQQRVTNLGQELTRQAAIVQRNPSRLDEYNRYRRAYQEAVAQLQSLNNRANILAAATADAPIQPNGAPVVTQAPAARPAATGMTPSYPAPTSEERARIRRVFGG